jgi:hypothetical protein
LCRFTRCATKVRCNFAYRFDANGGLR